MTDLQVPDRHPTVGIAYLGWHLGRTVQRQPATKSDVSGCSRGARVVGKTTALLLAGHRQLGGLLFVE